MRKNITVKGFIPLFLFLLVASCKEDGTNIGINLRNDGGAIGDSLAVYKDVIARTIDEDSLRTDSLSDNILGAMNDPLFGLSRATLVCQPLLTDFGYDFSDAVLDSVILTLKFKRSQTVDGIENLLTYGNLNTEMTLHIYKLDEDLEPGKRYYSNFKPTLGQEIGTYTGTFKFFDSVMVVSGGDTFMEPPQMRIRLNDAFGNEILSEPTSTFASDESFLQFLKGIVIVPEITLASGEGAIVGIETSSSTNGITIFYDGTKSQRFPFVDDSEHIGVYEIISQPMSITEQKTGSGHYNEVYVQSMAGTKVKIDIPELNVLIEKGERIAILDAKISFPVQPGTVNGNYGAPHRLLLFQPDPENGGNSVILDFIDDVAPPNIYWNNYSNYNGRYNSSSSVYEFHFTRYLQAVVNNYIETGENTFGGFYLLTPSDFPLTPSRVVINTDLLNGAEVSISYSKLN